MKLTDVIKPGMKGAFYGRYSTDKQKMETQRQSAYDLAKELECEIINHYEDHGVSSRKNKIEQRKELYKLMSDSKNKIFDFIVVSDRDRLARNPLEHEILRAFFKTYEIPVVICSDKTFYEDGQDKFYKLLRDMFTKYEIDNILRRTRDGLINIAHKGIWTGGNPPFGYSYNNIEKKLIPHPEELMVVKNIFDLYKNGEGFHSIAKKLPKESNNDKNWTKEKVKSIIINPIYAGYLSWGKTASSTNILRDREDWIIVKSRLIEPIINFKDWEECWKKYNDKKNGKVSPRYLKTSFLLKDIILCKNCNKKLQTKDQTTTSNSGKKYGSKIYFCPSCGLKIKADEFHNFIIDKILNDIKGNTTENTQEKVKNSFEKDIKSIEKDKSALENTIKDKKDQIVKLEEQIQKLMKEKIPENKKMIKILTIYRIHLEKRLKNIKKRIKDCEKENDRIKNISCKPVTWNYILKYVLNPREQIDNINIRQMLLFFIKDISIDKDKKVKFRARYDIDKIQKVNTSQIEISF